MKHKWTTLAIALGIVTLAAGLNSISRGEESGHFHVGLVITLSAIACRLANIRRRDARHHEYLKVEIILIGIVGLMIFMHKNLLFLISTDPVPYLVIPLMCISFYVYAFFRARRASPSQEPSNTQAQKPEGQISIEGWSGIADWFQERYQFLDQCSYIADWLNQTCPSWSFEDTGLTKPTTEGTGACREISIFFLQEKIGKIGIFVQTQYATSFHMNISLSNARRFDARSIYGLVSTSAQIAIPKIDVDTRVSILEAMTALIWNAQEPNKGDYSFSLTFPITRTEPLRVHEPNLDARLTELYVSIINYSKK